MKSNLVQRVINAFFLFLRKHEKRKAYLYENGILSYIKGNSGYVLVIVLIVIAVLISVSSEFLIMAQVNTRYLTKFKEQQQAYTLAKAGLNLGKFILEADKKGISSGFLGMTPADSSLDSYRDIWAIDYPQIPFENGELDLNISDENSKINLSILANEVVDQTPYYYITQRFFLNMGLPIDLADTIIDWVDIDDSRFPYGAESEYYMTYSPPYEAKNAAMDSINELLMVKGITPEIYYGMGGGNIGLEENLVENNKGLPQVSTGTSITDGVSLESRPVEEIPIGKEKNRALHKYFRVYGDRQDYLNEINKININTASYRVLSALTENMTDDIVTELIRRRHIQPFKSVDEVSDLVDDENTRKNILTVRSHIFKITSTVHVGKTRVTIVSYYNRDRKKILYWSEE